jgi:hypothetical protein
MIQRYAGAEADEPGAAVHEARQILASAQQRQPAQLGIGRDEYEEVLCLGRRTLTRRRKGAYPVISAPRPA